jgi:signal transduction histidine kinase
MQVLSLFDTLFISKQNSKFVRDKNDNPFLLKMLAITSLLSLFGLIMIAWSMNRQGSDLVEHEKQYSDIVLLKSEILHLDEVLTMFCRMAGLTGDVKWIQRYENHVNILDQKIEALMQLAPSHLFQTVTQTQKVNNYLVDLELKAFVQIKKQNLKKAMEYLNQNHYQTLKKQYNQGLITLTTGIKDFLNHKVINASTYYDFLGVLAVIIIIFLTIAWMILLNTLYRWKKLIFDSYQEAESVEKRLETTLQMTQLGIFSTTLDCQVFQISSKTADLFKVQYQENIYIQNLLQNIQSVDQKVLLSRLTNATNHQHTQLQHYNCEIINQNKITWIRIHWLIYQKGTSNTLFGWVKDITNEKQKTATLYQHNLILQKDVKKRIKRSKTKQNQIEMLLYSLLKAEKQEKSRLARLVHDDLQQVLVVARMQTAMVRDLPKLETNTFHQIINYIDEAIISTRDLTTRLSSSELLDQSLIENITKLSSKMKHRYQLDIMIEHNLEQIEINPEIILLSYQLIHELLFNIVKHAKVNKAYVIIKYLAQNLHIQVRDKGVGFNTQKLRQEQHISFDTGLGLSSMQSRLAIIDGQISIDSSVDEGCKINIHLPMVTESQ